MRVLGEEIVEVEGEDEWKGDIPADSRTPDLDHHLAFCKVFSRGGFILRRRRVSDPKIVFGIREDAYVALRGGDGRRGRHLDRLV